MSIGVVDRKLLWGRSHNQCAFPGCSQQLTVDLDDPESQVLSDAGAVLGEEAHIRSSKEDGPRHDSDYDSTKIDSYANLILLCPTHHTLVDKDGGRSHSVEDLENMRNDHEALMHARESLADEHRRVLIERMAARIQVWEQKIGVADWQNLTWMLNYPTPYIRTAQRARLFDTGEWLLAQDWPAEFPRVGEAFQRFRQVLRVLVEHIATDFELKPDTDRWELDRSHKRIPWNPPLYAELIERYRLNCMITWFLTVELTRAANWIIKAVRTDLDPLYRFDAGMILMREGDGIIQNQILRVEYQSREWGQDFKSVELDELRSELSAKADSESVWVDELNAYTLFDL